MNFREFLKFNEDRQYLLIHTPKGYNIFGPTSDEKLPNLKQGVELANHPDNMWDIDIIDGKLKLPPELEKDREKILHAYYKRFGFDVHATELPHFSDTEGDTIDPDVFSFKKLKNKVPVLGNTIAWN